MNVCNYGHGEVCYDSYSCPACALVKERDDLREKVKELDKSNDDLIREITELEEKLAAVPDREG